MALVTVKIPEEAVKAFLETLNEYRLLAKEARAELAALKAGRKALSE